MKEDSKYQNYTIEDFVDDKDFRSWINSPNEILNSFWINYQRDYPEKSEIIEQASQIIKALFIEERTISYEEYQGSIKRLENYLDEKSSRKNKIKWLFVNWRNVAAVLLLPVIILNIYLYASKNVNHTSGQIMQYIVPEGQKSKVILADGTLVWLNSGSTLSVSLDNTNRRKVKLTGEAYFDVTKDKNVPFLCK